jgi:hypothetical protein
VVLFVVAPTPTTVSPPMVSAEAVSSPPSFDVAVPVSSAVDAGLMQLDAAIESAYLRGADSEEVESLLQTRLRIVESLSTSSPALVARL